MNNLQYRKHSFSASIFIFILILLLISSAIPGKAKSLPQQKTPGTVKINILSKHIRLIKENRGEIIFTLPRGTVIRGEGSGFYAGDLRIKGSQDRFPLSADGRELKPGRYIITHAEQDKLFNVKIDGIERIYPLPLEILNSKESLSFFVTETAEQYATDSASAELGYIKPQSSEALQALALAIQGRCGIPSLRNKHEGCDFCDLTCCQIYRGRSGISPVTGPFIDPSKLQCGLSFHSSSGGRLFTEGIFNRSGRKVKPPADIIYSENFMLSRKMHRGWEAVLGRGEASSIIFPGGDKTVRDITFAPDREIVMLGTESGAYTIPPEELRLKINRVRGWNFIKSNNYTLTRDSENYIFRGSGLGHCAGMSLEGAVQLAERGYSRYEILEHYYPDLAYIKQGNIHSSHQYVTYSTADGSVIYSSTGPALLKRRVPCGSLFKLFTVIYLAEKRPDLLFNHRHRCEEKNPRPLPEQCWNRRGHGMMNSRSAISYSCNVWFASLHDRIDRDDYRRWFSEFVKSQKISTRLPEIRSDEEWGSILAGLDFRTDISVRDLIRLSLFIKNAGTNLHPDAAALITDSLKDTFISGTAEITDKERKKNIAPEILPPGIWGKTGTVIAGTNSHHSYGLFTGGAGDTGIIMILRKGKGADAAHLSPSLLKAHHQEFNTEK